MILLLGNPADPILASVCARLLDRGLDFLVIDPRYRSGDVDISWRVGDGVEGAIRVGTRQVPLSAVRSVFVRGLLFWGSDRAVNGNGSEARATSTGRSGVARDSNFAPWQDILYAFADSAPLLVVDRPSASASNASKPYQQRVVANHGFLVPRTLVTMVPEDVARFYEDCRGQVIYKSISYLRSIVTRMTPTDLARADQVRNCPSQFQEYIPGVDVRVHVVGRRLFATEIRTEAIDYRYAAREGALREMRAVEIPAEIADRCLRLAESIGIRLAGIDLRRSPTGEFFCFEVNPTPGFTFYESATGQRIGDALVDLLAGETQ